jgi:NAD(P)-dependent dehydrogenase (short-subunit alcohol dehydrogenase family)
VVIVTGAARGLGQAVAEAFALQGARIAIVDVDEAGLAETAAQLHVPPDRLLVMGADLSELAAIESIVARTVATFGRIDVLINNAAIVDDVALDEITPDLFSRVIDVNLRAPLFLSRAALRVMRGQGGGRIVNVASTIFCYAASKGGLLALTRSFAKIGATDNVLVNAVLPANIDSPMLWDTFAHDAVAKVLAAVPLGRTAKPEEVTELILWLASPASSYVTGASWDINGGCLMS